LFSKILISEKFRFLIEFAVFEDFFGKIVFLCLFIYFLQPNLALHCWPQLWQLRYPRDQALYLFLFGTGTFIFLVIWPVFDGLGVILLN